MLRIYQLSDPVNFLTQLLPALRDHGELTYDEIDELTGTPSYRSSYISFGKYICLFKNEHEIIVGNPTELSSVSRLPNSETIARLVLRLPQYRRWLTLWGGSELPNNDTITTHKERGMTTRDNRTQLFKKWTKSLENLLSTSNFDTVVPNYPPRYVWDSFVSRSGYYGPVALLVLLAAAGQQSAGLRINRAKKFLGLSDSEFAKIIDSILLPAGIPIKTTGNTLVLTDDIKLLIESTDDFEQVLNEVFPNLASNGQTEELLATIADQLKSRTNLLTWDYPSLSDSLAVSLSVSSQHDNFLYSVTADLSALPLNDLYQRTQTAPGVSLGAKQLGDMNLITSVRRYLTAVQNDNQNISDMPDVDNSVQYHLRTGLAYAGRLPFIAGKEYTTVTPLGEYFLSKSGAERLQMVQQLEFVCNPLLRDVVCLAALGIVVRSNGDWICRLESSCEPLIDVLVDLLAAGESAQRFIGDALVARTVINLGKDIHMVQMAPGKSYLELDKNFGEHLRSGDLGIFELFKSRKQELRSSLLEVVV